MQDARHRSMNHLAREASRDGRILSLREQEYLILVYCAVRIAVRKETKGWDKCSQSRWRLALFFAKTKPDVFPGFDNIVIIIQSY